MSTGSMLCLQILSRHPTTQSSSSIDSLPLAHSAAATDHLCSCYLSVLPLNAACTHPLPCQMSPQITTLRSLPVAKAGLAAGRIFLQRSTVTMLIMLSNIGSLNFICCNRKVSVREMCMSEKSQLSWAQNRVTRVFSDHTEQVGSMHYQLKAK